MECFCIYLVIHLDGWIKDLNIFLNCCLSHDLPLYELPLTAMPTLHGPRLHA